jgi:hypothetical protein
MANWLSTDASICWHDRKYSKELLDSPKIVGFSGPELVVQFEEIRDEVPDAEWVVVLRNEAEALASFKRWAGDLLPQDDIVDKFWKERCHTLSMVSSHANVTLVDYNDLDNQEVCEGIWRTLLPMIPFDPERWKLLNELNVQQHLEKNLNKWPILAKL